MVSVLVPDSGRAGRTVRTITALAAAAAAAIATGCSQAADPQPERPVADRSTEETSVVADSDSTTCEGGVPLHREMATGSSWSLCFRVHPQTGMVIDDLTFAPVPDGPVTVAHQITLAQLEVPYDTGDRLTSDITDAGFGGLKMQSLTDAECAGELVEIGVPDIGDGTQFGETPVRPVLCSEVAETTLAYRSEENGEVVVGGAETWSLFTISKVGWYEYVARYALGSDGSILPSFGATGDLSPVDYAHDERHGSAVGPGETDHAASHAHNAVWRIHWALGGGPLTVEQYDARPTGRWGARSPILSGRLHELSRPATARRADRRWWRVVASDLRNENGHAASYEIDLGDSDSFVFADDVARGRRTGYDVAFTNADECAEFATGNRGPCGDGVLDYVAAGRHDRLIDVASWVAIGYHHVPRDEDQSPMQLHWQGFSLLPRDLTSQRIDLPAGREGLDGRPDTWNGESVEDIESP